MALIQLWILLSAAAGMSHSIICLHKQQHMGITSSNITCPSDYYCSRTQTEHNSDITAGFKSEYLDYNCVRRDRCNFFGSFSAEQKRRTVTITCCDTDSCSPEVPAKGILSNPAFNGVTCPSCYDPYKTFCDTGEIMKCSGNESTCALLSYYGMVFRGCATESFCSNSSDVYYAISSVYLDFTCTSAAKSPAFYNIFSVFFPFAIIHLLV